MQAHLYPVSFPNRFKIQMGWLHNVFLLPTEQILAGKELACVLLRRARPAEFLMIPSVLAGMLVRG